MNNNWYLSDVRILDIWDDMQYTGFFYKNSFYKNHQAQNCQKIKNILRIMPRLKYMIKNLESPILILH